MAICSKDLNKTQTQENRTVKLYKAITKIWDTLYLIKCVRLETRTARVLEHLIS